VKKNHAQPEFTSCAVQVDARCEQAQQADSEIHFVEAVQEETNPIDNPDDPETSLEFECGRAHEGLSCGAAPCAATKPFPQRTRQREAVQAESYETCAEMSSESCAAVETQSGVSLAERVINTR